VSSKQKAAGWLTVLCLWAGASGVAQEIRLDGQSTAKKPHLKLLTDGVDVKAGSEQVVELRFRVDEGYHINSHLPMDDLLIPTTLKLAPGTVKVAGTEYPKGEIIKLLGNGEGLDVYQGEFKVKLRVVAPRGFSTMTGTVRYQACDNEACFPPKTLAVKIVVTAK
jgi:Disulphide bond corrector protein DsbC